MFFSNDNSKILEMLDNIELYLDNELNELPNYDFKGSSAFEKQLKEKLDNIYKKINNKNNEELLIYGEIMLVSEKIQNGNFSDKVYHTNTSNYKLNYIAKTINELVDHINSNFKSMTEILESFEHLNYLNKLDEKNVQNDFKKVFHYINGLRDSIVKGLHESKTTSIELQKNSNELLDNVNSLNDNSNSAAANLEETAAAVEEITSNTSNNTSNIVKMAQFAKELESSTNEGQSLAEQTTESMEDINNQVTSINEAIEIIDQIAFQTNILSLNAAVEAATAGEAGKGFAVVAAEVRNLANRSAEAAKQIKDIVELANTKSQKGRDITHKMRNGFEKISENIKNTLHLIEDIEMSSKEQLSGIQQINDALSNLDKQTQQNANIASHTHDIAMKTESLANQVVENVNRNTF